MSTRARVALLLAGASLAAPATVSAAPAAADAAPGDRHGGVAVPTAAEARAAATKKRSAAKQRARLRPRTRALLERIAACESGGDPKAVSPDGRYRGKYQFHRDTWRGVGGDGDPAAAPEHEQDRRAAKLLRLQGRSAWPTCGAR